MKGRRYVLFAVCLLIGVLFTALCGCGTGLYTYSNADAYSVGSGSVSANGIQKIDIDWIGGSVSVERAEGDEITFFEDAGYLGEDYRLRYLAEGDTLRIKFMKSGKSSSGNHSKPLTLQIPAELYLEELDIDNVAGNVLVEGAQMQMASVRLESVSGNVLLTGLTAEELRAESVSGKVGVKECTVNTARLQSVSGDVVFGYCEGVKTLRLETVSGAVFFSTEKPVVGTVSAETVSGEIQLLFSEGLGFVATFDRKSNAVQNEVGAELRGDGYYLAGDGDCKITVKSISGALKLLKLI